MPSVHVALLSGRSVALSAAGAVRAEDLRRAAQRKLGRHLAQLVLHGQVLEDHTLQELQGGETFFALARRCQVVSSRRSAAFAAILEDGSVATWGHPQFGGDSSEVAEQLTEVVDIAAATLAFAALKADGTVVSWGHANFGGWSAGVHEQLVDVVKVRAARDAFAAIRADGSVVTWGNAGTGGACTLQLREVQEISATCEAFAALRQDGSVVTWGRADWGGDSSQVSEQLREVQQVAASSRAFCALRRDGQLVAWGDAGCGGDGPEEAGETNGRLRSQKGRAKASPARPRRWWRPTTPSRRSARTARWSPGAAPRAAAIAATWSSPTCRTSWRQGKPLPPCGVMGLWSPGVLRRLVEIR
ncbi:unnamed protein product [Effrenium voratum]|uniref:Uncharacterized protein n=1 Tax=Effrenium voratum TaxID=2562239 RepID=A0AA36MYR8_9DINO|nr:unnamed protein product [Effrenium voratum]CAJ1429145.1 unnamed protein product [Effrenium voratum]